MRIELGGYSYFIGKQPTFIGKWKSSNYGKLLKVDGLVFAHTIHC